MRVHYTFAILAALVGLAMAVLPAVQDGRNLWVV
jgi:hypothetical protein